MLPSVEAQIAAALSSKAPESTTLDYKLAAYEQTEGGRKEFAKDLAAFANRDGGLLVIGVRESQGVPTEVVGVPPEATDAVVLWLESVARSGVTPHHSGVSIRLTTYEGKRLIGIEVPRGLDQPYEVPSAGARFFVRDERSVRPMSREELKFALRREADIAQRIAHFCDSMWNDFITPNRFSRNQLSALQGGSQLVVFPIFDRSFDFRYDLPTIARKFPSRDAFHQRASGGRRATIDGLEYQQCDYSDEWFPGFVRIYRHGAVHLADGYVMNFRENEGQPAPHPGGLLMDSLIGSIRTSVETSHEITGAQNFWIDFRIRTKAGYRIAFFRDPFSDRGGIADREEMVFDPIVLHLEDGWGEHVPSLVRPLLDQIWQGFGFETCGYFKGNGDYARPR